MKFVDTTKEEVVVQGKFVFTPELTEEEHSLLHTLLDSMGEASSKMGRHDIGNMIVSLMTKTLCPSCKLKEGCEGVKLFPIPQDTTLTSDEEKLLHSVLGGYLLFLTSKGGPTEVVPTVQFQTGVSLLKKFCCNTCLKKEDCSLFPVLSIL